MEPETPPPDVGAQPAETGASAETSGFTETGSGEPSETSAEPERAPDSELEPPPIMLESEAGRQEAVQGSYCITHVSESGESAGVCADTAFPHPNELSLVAPGANVTIEVAEATLSVPEGSTGVSSNVIVYPLGCGPDRGRCRLRGLESASMSWAVVFEPGAYEFTVFAYFDDGKGTTGDASGGLGLLVDPEREPAVIPVDGTLAVCPYPEQP